MSSEYINSGNGQIGLRGEYLAVAELMRLGYNACRADGNSKDIDVLAARGRETIQVQVKATGRATGDYPLAPDRIHDYVVYMFIDMSSRYPRFFMISGSDLAAPDSDLYYRSPCGTRGVVRRNRLARYEIVD
jgi:hypothetical protein